MTTVVYFALWTAVIVLTIEVVRLRKANAVLMSNFMKSLFGIK